MTDLEEAVEQISADAIARRAKIYAEWKGLRATPETIERGVSFATVTVSLSKLCTILDALASITRERDAMREAGKPFFDLAKTVTTPASGSLPWWQESQDWTVVFSFAGCAVTLGDLRRAAALVNGEGGE